MQQCHQHRTQIEQGSQEIEALKSALSSERGRAVELQGERDRLLGEVSLQTLVW